jgi:FKBP12-rapamycin complex-associated protein
MPPFLNMMRVCPIGILEFNFQQLLGLVNITKANIKAHVEDIIKIVLQHCSNGNNNILLTILNLVEAIANALDAEFRVYLPSLLPTMLQLIESDVGEKRVVTLKILHALVLFGENLEEYLHIVIPTVVKLFEKSDVPIHVRKTAIQAVGQLCRRVNFSDNASRIIHPLARVLGSPAADLRQTVMETLCAIVVQLNLDYAIFIPTVNKVSNVFIFRHSCKK